jgi:deoxyribodipyrimidine photo-lyase
MQQSQRAEDNPALSLAIGEADRRRLPLAVVFGLTDAYPEANLRHYAFLVEGLRETRARLADRGVRAAVRRGNPPDVARAAAADAALLVCDAGYLAHQRAWRRKVAETFEGPVIEVESDVVVPSRLASNKAEYAARTFRPRVGRHVERFLALPETPAPRADGRDLDLPGGPDADLDAILDALDVDRTIEPVSAFFQGGTGEAKRRFREFLEHRFPRYVEHRNQPQTDDVSRMSPYLHFGQVSPVWLALRARALRDDLPEAVDSYLEELIVRRELSANYVLQTPDYDRFTALPHWARKTLQEHRDDPREHHYTVAELAAAETHDPYWNAAMREMRVTGFMHNYMRMYWGKKILEWRNTPDHAFHAALELNNRYFLDGRDPASFANVAWIFGLHDRAWKERPIFGKVRYMAATGLERKCDIQGYVDKVAALVQRANADA